MNPIAQLYELAMRENLLADTAFEDQPVPYIIDLGTDGQYLGVRESRGETIVPSKIKGGEPKKKRDSGRRISIPRVVGNAANQGAARFFADTIPRVVPMTYDLAGKPDAGDEQAKRERSRATFWKQIDTAANDIDDPALRSVQSFGRSLASDPVLAAKVEQELEAKGAAANDRCTFAYAAHNGRTLVDDAAAREWFKKHHDKETGTKQKAGPRGFCQIKKSMGPIPTTHPLKLMVPGWMSMGVSLISFDKAAFESYGLEGTANASIGYEAADAYGIALKALVRNELPRRVHSASRVGDSLFLYWTREPAPLDLMDQLDAPNPMVVENMIASAAAGEQRTAAVDPNDFYCLVLSGNAARAIVRDYIEEPLANVQINVAKWFRDLKIASINKADLGHPIATFRLWQLAASITAKKSGDQPDWQRINDLVPRLMAAALKHEPLPDSILAACLSRIRAELGKGFRPARMALIKLSLIRKGIPVKEQHDPTETNPAYICGELLALFDQIQHAALPGVKASVIDKHYGGFSAAPSTALGLLFANAQNHLRSIRGEKPALATSLGNRLAVATQKLKDVPEGQLTLTDQARFALGYYHAKAERLAYWAKRKQEKAEAEARRKQEKAEAEARKRAGQTDGTSPDKQS